MALPAAPLLYWCEATHAQPFETGIQRVTRRLGCGLDVRGVPLVPVGWEPRARMMRRLGAAEPERFDGPDFAEAWVLVPEIPTTVLGDGLDPIQLAGAYGLRSAAIVHDLIPVRCPDLYGPGERALFERYFRMFAQADLVLATTRLVAGHLAAFLKERGLPAPRETAIVPLPAQLGELPRIREAPPPRRPGEPLRLLTVSTWEPRKNLARLLRAVRLACERDGAAIHVTLVGRRAGHAAHDREVMALLAELPRAVALDHVADAALAGLYASHHASAYPSCEEGFGMPVLESLWLGRPCLCHTGSALAEVAPGGGTMLVDMADEEVIAAGLLRLERKPRLLARLTAEALARPLQDWSGYAAGVAAAMDQAGWTRQVPPVRRWASRLPRLRRAMPRLLSCDPRIP